MTDQLTAATIRYNLSETRRCRRDSDLGAVAKYQARVRYAITYARRSA